MRIPIRIQQQMPIFSLIGVIGFLVIRVCIIFLQETDLAGIEQNVVYSIQVLLDNGKLYQSPATIPFSITQYTPLYYYLCGLVVRISGHGSSDQIELIYTIGRSINIIFNLITACFVYIIGRTFFSVTKNNAVFLFLLSFAFTFSQNFAIRPDSLCDMLGMASIYFVLLYQKEDKGTIKSTLLLTFIVLLTAVAVFSKQSGIQLIIIILGFSVLIKDFKTVFKILALQIIIYGSLLLFFKNIYPSFFENVIGGIANGISIENFLKYVIGKKLFIISVWPIIFICFFFIIKQNQIFKGEIANRLLAVYVLGSFIFATGTALKMGSTVQYYVLFLNLALILIMKEINSAQVLYTKIGKPVITKISLIFYGYLILMVVTYAVYDYSYITKTNKQELITQRKNATLVAQYIQSNSSATDHKYIFSNLTTDNSIASRQGLNNILFKTCLIPQMDILQYSSAKSKVLGYQNFERMITNGQVEYIISSVPKQPFNIIENIDSLLTTKYSLVKTFDNYQIYKYQ